MTSLGATRVVDSDTFLVSARMSRDDSKKHAAHSSEVIAVVDVVGLRPVSATN